MNYQGTIIEESLKGKSVLSEVKILKTEISPVTKEDGTPWLKQWTLHTVEVPEEKAEEIAEKISKSLDYSHKSAWYADFKNETTHYIIFENKVFKIGRSAQEYAEVTKYGMSLGIPEKQLDFPHEIK